MPLQSHSQLTITDTTDQLCYDLYINDHMLCSLCTGFLCEALYSITLVQVKYPILQIKYNVLEGSSEWWKTFLLLPAWAIYTFSFLVVMAKYLTRINLKKKGFVVAQFKSTEHHDKGGMVSGYCSYMGRSGSWESWILVFSWLSHFVF